MPAPSITVKFRSLFPSRSRPAGDATAEHRVERRLMVAALAGAVVCGSVAFHDDDPDLRGLAASEARQIAIAERQAVEAYHAIVADARAGRLPDAEAIDRIEREVLPTWREARRRVDAARSGPLADFFPPELAEFFRLRQEGWETLVAGVRSKNPGLIARHRQAWQAAERVRAKLAATPQGPAEGLALP